jgi:hypothetical protein
MMNGKDGNAGCSRRIATILIAYMALNLAGCFDDTDNISRLQPTTTPSNPSPTTGNRAPVISGTPVTTAKVGASYSFQPSASDADGDRLTFQVKSKPGWATFSNSTGRLSGTPPTGSTGTFTGVQIIVNDGKTSTSMDPFAISVTEPSVGSIELAWQAPSANEDGTPLEDLAGYVIRYGRSAGALSQSVRIDVGITMYVVEGLTEGTWYFSLSSVNSSGVESRPNGYVAKTIS